ncbi:MAG: 50S ribosomal protein L24 [Candidatus Pacebacteria bacterium]|nr:50S ribosomal protein L24 [Candidatus Paceibacterota bacterium]
MKVKKGDKVKVLSGKDKGKSGVILRALPKENKVIVEGIALAKRHLKGVGGKVGSIAERPRAIDASNVQLLKSEAKMTSALDEATKKKAKSVKK